MTPFEIVQGELIEWLEQYEGPRFHAVLSDPPYALISIAKRFGPGQEEAQEGSDGRYRRLSAGFMGQEWDGFNSLAEYQQWVADWSRLMIERALYPGAVCLFFGGTRTWHRLACGLEDGGFEVYDTIMWVYGQGFPKSHDISKFIDKQAGAERTEVEGVKPGHQEFAGRETAGHSQAWADSSLAGFDRPWMHDPEARARYHMKMKPATEDAEHWDGYGTALKPAWEPIIVCRAPRGDHGYADLALQFGTGALNIDASRIGYQDTGDKEAAKPQGRATAKAGLLAGGTENDNERTVFDVPENSGRWPSNFGLQHTEFCIPVGEADVEARVINRWKDGMKPFGGGAGGEYETVHPSRQGEESAERTYEDKGGTDFAMKPGARRDPATEAVAIWACIPECPVRRLEDQAGVQRSGAWPKRRISDQTRVVYGEYAGDMSESKIGASAGTVSRFYYCSKSSRSERDLGLEDFHWRRGDEGWERIDNPDAYEGERIINGNVHPTVKPLELCRYLATLILPPVLDEPRRILVPFAGSGSEMIGARQAEWDQVVGVELKGEYVEMAEARLTANLGMF